MPFFSILIPSYNRPEDLTRCILSILKNSFSDYEIIVSDDNSPKRDEVIEVISSFGELEKLRFYSQPENLREPENKNFLVRSATGKFNIVIGDDDTFTDNALASIHNFIQCNPGHDIYGLGYTIVDEYGLSITEHKAPHAVELNSFRCRKLILEAGTLPMTIFHPATFCCRSGLELEYPYRSNIGIGEDLCFIFEAVLSEKSICVIPKSMFNWRKVQDTKSIEQGNQSAEHLASFKSKSLIYEVIADIGPSTSKIKAYLNSFTFRERFLYRELLRDGNFDALIQNKLTLEHTMIKEISSLNRSLFWRFKLIFLRFERISELVGIFGLLATVRMLTNFMFFAACQYFPSSKSKNITNK